MMNEKTSLKSTLQALLYLAPMLIIVGTFSIYPAIKAFIMSFYLDYNLFTGEIDGLGLDNFRYIFADADFHLAMKNTFVFVAFVVPISIILSLIIAMMINKIKFLQGFFQSVYFLPLVTSTVAVSIVWSWLYHSQYGLINYGLNLLGIDSISWLGNPDYAMPAIIIMSIWKSLGLNILLFLVGLNAINDTYYKAAKIDGASSWQRFKNITVPLLGPTIFLVSINALINNFKVFDEVYALFSGQPGPGKSTLTVVYYLYEKFYEEFNYGVASAAGVFLFLVILVFTLIQMVIRQKTDYQEGR